MTSVSSASSSTSEVYSGRQAPWSREAEAAVLGAMMLDQDAALRAAELLEDTMFYQEANRRLFRAMLAIVRRKEVIDPITLRDELVTRGDLDAAGGMEYVGSLVDVVPTAANVSYHAKIVRDKAVLRRLIEASTQIIQMAYEARDPPHELLDRAEERIFQVAQLRQAEDFVRIKELLWPTMERIESLDRGGKSITGVASGFVDLDNLTAGFQAADFIVVAARPSMGKTSFALNVAQHAAIEEGVGVAVFSLEMSKEALVQRMLCAEGLVDAQRLRRAQLRDDDYTKLARAAGILDAAPIWIDDTGVLSPLEMRAKARRLKADHENLGLIIVDYLQLMQGPGGAESRQQEISSISRSLKALAKELNVPVVGLSQLSRAPEQRTGDHRPKLSDLRESGAIEQDADLVLFIYREEVYSGPQDKDGNSLEGLGEIIVGKHRNGPTGKVDVYFKKEYTRFQNRTPREQDDASPF